MRQKGKKNVNKNDRSGPEAPVTTHGELRWMKSRKHSRHHKVLLKERDLYV